MKSMMFMTSKIFIGSSVSIETSEGNKTEFRITNFQVGTINFLLMKLY